jgi:hypothetical protein
MTPLKPGTRVRHIYTDEHATVVARDPDRWCPPEATPVIYDNEFDVWHTPTVKLEPMTEESR